MPTEQELWEVAARLLGEDEEDASTYAQALAFEASARGDQLNAALWWSVSNKIEALRSARAARE
jgi:hypothetical protein